MKDYKCLYPYFGGKSSVAPLIWARFGDVGNYVEPFFGSGATLFMRPDGFKGTETVNDADGFICNVWRAIKAAPDEVAKHADNPVNECDLHARHMWLVGQRERITDRLCGDPEYYDAKAAGWWIWGASCWIGGGWCSGSGPWTSVDGVMVKTGKAAPGVNRKRPHLGGSGGGQGVNRPTLDLPQLIGKFADRLRRVRVCCGDWQRVCTNIVTTGRGICGVFLDPPYSDLATRTDGCYAVDSLDVAHRVREWAIEQGANPLMRICLAGYEGEHNMPADWDVKEWKANGGQANAGDGVGRENAKRERLWFSPACVRPRENACMFAGAQ